MSTQAARRRWDEIRASGRKAKLKIAILSTFTADFVVPHLGVALEDDQLAADLFVGPYNQIPQECMSESSSTAASRPDVLVVWPRFEDLWGQLPSPLVEGGAYVERASALVEVAIAGAGRMGATLVFVLPAIPELRPLGVGDACNPAGVAAVAAQAREALRRRLAAHPGALVFDLEEVVRWVGSSRAYNTRLAALAHMPFSEATLAAAGTGLARSIRMGRRAAKKAIIVDADNTLWGGVLGEDGAAGINLKPNGPGVGFLEFQRYLCDLRRAGVLIALVSKNDERDVWAVFERRDMVLKKSDLTAWRIGWQPKSASIAQIAEELSLGVESFVFVDDNPAEIAEVGAALPSVACVRFPADPVEWMQAIQGAGILDRTPPTQEDLGRATFYAQDRLRKDTMATAASPDDYLAQLDIVVSVFQPKAVDMPRLAQLIAKTNQFNLNGIRRTEQELESLLRDGKHTARMVTATDAFGDYGTVGAFIVEHAADSSQLDTFVLSCRAMGRGIEEAMIAAIFEVADGRGVHALLAELPRNEPARRFFQRMGCVELGTACALASIAWPTYVKRAVTS